MYTVSDKFKEVVQSNAVVATARIILVADNTVIDGNDLTSVTIRDYCNNDGVIIGTAMSKEVEIELINRGYDLADKEFLLEVGIEVDTDTIEYIPYGNFTVKEYTDMKSNNRYKLVAYDYMDKLNKEFTDNNTYPMTLQAFYEAFATQYRVQIETQTLPNQEFIIEEKPFFEGSTGRAVLTAIAQMFGSFAKFNRNNKLQMYLKNETNETISRDQMNSALEIDNRYGPINTVVLSLGNVEGENLTLKDTESVATYGETILEIVDNPFVYTEELRSKAIQGIYDRVLGFTYIPTSFNYKAYLYLDCGDAVQVQQMKTDDYVDTIILNQEIKVPATRQSKCTNTALTKTQVQNQYVSPEKQAQRKTGIMVDKQNQTIESVVSQTNEQNQKINRVVQTVDELNSKISDVADITTSKDSSNGVLEFESINESEPIRVEIRPISENISYLYPRNNLFPSNNLYPKARTLRFTNTETGEVSDYELPNDLLYYDSENYDEFILDYDSQTCLVNKKVGLNSDGTTYVLATPSTIDYDYPIIPLTDGDYKVELLGYNTVYMFVRLMSQNIYTTQFATKAEVQSQLSQTTNSILAEVNADITTLDQNVDRKITNVNAKLELKVNADELISEINASADVIRLDSNRLIIDSDYYKLSEDGVMDAVAGKIGGYNISENNLSAEIYPEKNFKDEDTQKIIDYIMGVGTLTEEEKKLYDLNNDGEINAADVVLMRQLINANVTTTEHGKIYINRKDPINTIAIEDKDGNIRTRIGLLRVQAENVFTSNLNADNIQSGNVLITPEPNIPTSVDIEFDTPFTGIEPNVVATAATAVPGTKVTGVSVSNITLTGFKLWITRTNDTETGINWVAIN